MPKSKVSVLIVVASLGFGARAFGANDGDYSDCGRTDDFNRAIAACTRIISGADETPIDRSVAYLNRGNSYVAANNIDQAIKDYSTAIALDPKSVVGYSSRAIAYALKADRDRAMEDFRAANRLDSVKVSSMVEASAELKTIGEAVAQHDRAASAAACKDALEHWKSAESIGTRAAFQAHLDLYPTCNFAPLARAKIAALDSAATSPSTPATTPSGVPPAPAASDSICSEPGSLWDMNGATMYLRAGPEQHQRTIYYCDTRHAGSVLFKGKRSGDHYEGRAFVVSAKCGPTGYDVKGEVLNDDRTIVVTGNQPKIDETNCSISGHTYARMELNYRSRN